MATTSQPEVFLKQKIETNRKNGRKGGEKVAEMYGQAFVEQRAQAGGQACLLRYGRGYYQALRARRGK